MKVEIGALVEKEYGQLVKDEVSQLAGVEYVFYAAGRSNDLFEQKQFGSFGEASIFTLCELHTKKSGVVYMSNPLVRSTL